MGERAMRARIKRIASAWVPAIAYMAVIFILSAQSKLPEPPGVFGWDKLQHSTAYAVLALILFRAVSIAPFLKFNTYAQALGFGALYGASDELHQKFVPGRTADPADWLGDIIGMSIGLVLLYIVRRILSGWRR